MEFLGQIHAAVRFNICSIYVTEADTPILPKKETIYTSLEHVQTLSQPSFITATVKDLLGNGKFHTHTNTEEGPDKPKGLDGNVCSCPSNIVTIVPPKWPWEIHHGRRSGPVLHKIIVSLSICSTVGDKAPLHSWILNIRRLLVAGTFTNNVQTAIVTYIPLRHILSIVLTNFNGNFISRPSLYTSQLLGSQGTQPTVYTPLWNQSSISYCHLERKKLPCLELNSWPSLPGSYPLTIRVWCICDFNLI